MLHVLLRPLPPVYQKELAQVVEQMRNNGEPVDEDLVVSTSNTADSVPLARALDIVII